MAENYVLLETIQLTQNAASVTFDNIPQTGYTDLKVVCSSRDDRSGQPNGDLTLRVAYNGTTNTGSIYTMKRVGGSGATGFSDGTATTSLPFGMSTSTTATANVYGNSEFYITNYTSSTSKSFSAEGASENNATTAFTALNAGLIATNNPITGIVIFPFLASNFIAGSTFSLYGIAALGTTPTVAPKATGGDIVANDGTYWYHAFLSSGTFTPQTSLTCDYLVVAGGGGGGNASSNGTDGAGGGGAGGLRSTVGTTGGGGSLESALSLTSNTTYTVTVGAGGSGGNTDNRGSNGSDSVFSTITSTGGGGGGGVASGQQTGGNGGSGGGGGCFSGATGGTGTSNQGYAGGAGATNGPAGGGGAGGVGANGVANSANGGNGGVGVQITTLATPTGTGANSGYYAGGGGGAADASSGNAGLGGNGGGGTGYTPTYLAGSGTTNTGGGGGGGGAPDSYAVGGNGGSGIVIIRYPK